MAVRQRAGGIEVARGPSQLRPIRLKESER